MGPGFESLKVHHGPLVKRLRHRPLTPVTGVRFSHGSPILIKGCKGGSLGNRIVRVDCDEGPPVPIPNTEVKLICADNTWRVTAREDRYCQHFAPLAQSVERRTVNPQVVGSSPTGGAKIDILRKRNVDFLLFPFSADCKFLIA